MPPPPPLLRLSWSRLLRFFSRGGCRPLLFPLGMCCWGFRASQKWMGEEEQAEAFRRRTRSFLAVSATPLWLSAFLAAGTLSRPLSLPFFGENILEAVRNSYR